MAFAMVEVASIASILFFLWIYSKYDRASSAQLPATGDTGRLQGSWRGSCQNLKAGRFD
jgi:hypothetical protein